MAACKLQKGLWLTRNTQVSNSAQVASTRQPASPLRVTTIVTSWSAIWSCGRHGERLFF